MRTDDEGAAPAAATEGSSTESQQPAGQSPARPERKKREKKAAEPSVSFRGPEYSTVETLVSAYNEMVPTAVDLGLKKVDVVQTFMSPDVGARACEQLHAAITKARAKVSTPSKPKKGEQKQKESTTMARTSAAKSKTTRKAAGKAASKRKAASGARSARFDKDSKISVLGKENPKRKGTEQHKRFEKLSKAHGKTVGDYLKTGETVTLRHAVAIGFAKVS